MEKDGSGGEKDGKDEGDHSQNEPGGSAAVLRGGVGDAEGSEKGIGEGFEKTHRLRIRREFGDGGGWRDGQGGWRREESERGGAHRMRCQCGRPMEPAG